jgi:hypothetical protein
MSYISITGMLKELGKSKTKGNANVLRYYFKDNLERINGGCFVYYDYFIRHKTQIRLEWDIIANDLHAQIITDLLMEGAKPTNHNNFDTRLVELEGEIKIVNEKLNKLINIFKQVKEL